MQSQIDPRALALARQDGQAHIETRAKFTDWSWKAYQLDGAAADRALEALIAQLHQQHTSARAVVANARPMATFTRRPASTDEQDF